MQNQSPDRYTALLYSKFSPSCKQIFTLLQDANMDLENFGISLISIDTPSFRNALKKNNQKLQINVVPTILSIYSDGVVEKFEGIQAYRWIEQLILQYNPPKAVIKLNKIPESPPTQLQEEVDYEERQKIPKKKIPRRKTPIIPDRVDDPPEPLPTAEELDNEDDEEEKTEERKKYEAYQRKVAAKRKSQGQQSAEVGTEMRELMGDRNVNPPNIPKILSDKGNYLPESEATSLYPTDERMDNRNINPPTSTKKKMSLADLAASMASERENLPVIPPKS